MQAVHVDAEVEHFAHGDVQDSQLAPLAHLPSGHGVTQELPSR